MAFGLLKDEVLSAVRQLCVDHGQLVVNVEKVLLWFFPTHLLQTEALNVQQPEKHVAFGSQAQYLGIPSSVLAQMTSSCLPRPATPRHAQHPFMSLFRFRELWEIENPHNRKSEVLHTSHQNRNQKRKTKRNTRTV